MGSGTTGEACINLKRRFIGVEIDKKFFETAQERIQKTCSHMASNFIIFTS